MHRLVLLFLLALAATPASADDRNFLNPFLAASDYLALRGDTANATMMLAYEERRSVPGSDEVLVAVTIDLAADWALLTSNGRSILYDFRLQRRFELLSDSSGFTSHNLADELAFRVLERQNRTMINEVVRLAGAEQLGDACDASAELGVTVGDAGAGGDTQVIRDGGVVGLECNGRQMGRIEPSEHGPSPATLWPVIARAMAVHPALFKELESLGTVPKLIESSFRQVGGVNARSWRLTSVTPSTLPYPLVEGLGNATEGWLARSIGESMARLAVKAASGTAAGGKPGYEEWDARLRALAAEDDGAAAALAVMPVLSMFPELVEQCPAKPTLSACQVLADFHSSMADPAVSAFVTVATAEQAGNADAVIEAMASARTSKHAQHPALNAAFGLALLRFGPDFAGKAAARGLPDDLFALIRSGIEAYPYNAAYWTDLGDAFAGRWDLATAMLLFDVASAVARPEARRTHEVLISKDSFVSRIRNDFPQFDLPR